MAWPFLKTVGNLFRSSRSFTANTRRLEAAGSGRASGITPGAPLPPEIMASGSVVRRRARGSFYNNGLIRNAVENWIAECVRSGVMAKPTLPYLIPFWKSWCRVADHNEITNFDGLSAQVLRSVIVDGEAFVQITTTPDGPRLVSLQPEQVAEDLTVTQPDGGYIVQGIEFNANGQRVAYHVRPYDPTQIYPTWSQPVRIDAADILHVFQPLMPGQVRGLSWLAPVLLSANELDAATDALIVAAKVAAMHCVILTDPNGDGADPYAVTPEPMQPGSVIRAPLGMDVKVSSPQQFASAAPLLRQITLQIAAGLGLPEHLVNGDLSNANYSSLRAGMIPFRARVEQFQYTVLCPQFFDKVWVRFIAEGVLSGRIDAPDYETNPENYVTDWIFPAFVQVDPLKAVQADAAEVAAGFSSRSQKVAERGWDIEDIDAQRAADATREKVPSVDPFETVAANQQEKPVNV